jgi:hypothetical protein
MTRRHVPYGACVAGEDHTRAVRHGPRRYAPETAGRMFWLRWKVLSGS